jgi:hypothetical protein
MLPSDCGIWAGATGRSQANHIYFQLWFHHFTVAYRVNIEQNLQHQLLLKILKKFKVVPKDVYGLLPTMGKAVNTISVN